MIVSGLRGQSFVFRCRVWCLVFRVWGLGSSARPASAAESVRVLDGPASGDKGPYALTPNTVELIPTLGALPPREGPVQDVVLTQDARGRGRTN